MRAPNEELEDSCSQEEYDQQPSSVRTIIYFTQYLVEFFYGAFISVPFTLPMLYLITNLFFQGSDDFPNINEDEEFNGEINSYFRATKLPKSDFFSSELSIVKKIKKDLGVFDGSILVKKLLAAGVNITDIRFSCYQEDILIPKSLS